MRNIKRNPHFIRQMGILDSLSATIHGQPHNPIAVSSPGGIGKSEVVVELAYQIQTKSPEVSIFLLDGSNDRCLRESMLKLVEEIRVAGGFGLNISPDIPALYSWLKSDECGHWLMIVDNINIGTSSAVAQLSDLLPSGGLGCLLITTRNRRAALNVTHPGMILDIPTMDEKDASNLLDSYTGLCGETAGYTARIVEILGYHPFAIAQAGLSIKTTSITVPDYCRALENSSTADEILVRGSKEFLATHNHHANLSPPSMAISFDDFKSQDIPILPMVSILACLGCSSIPSVYFSDSEHGDFRTSLSTLNDFHILKGNPVDGSVQMNSIARSIIRAYLRQSPHRVRFISYALRLVTHQETPAVISADTLAQSHIYATHVESVLGAITHMVLPAEMTPSGFAHVITSTLWLFQYFLTTGKVQDGCQLLRRVLHWGTDSLRTHCAHHNAIQSRVGIANYALGKLDAAWKTTNKVLCFQIRTLGDKDPETLHSLNNLGQVYESQGQYQEAERFHRKALSLKTEVFGPDNLDTLVSLNNLALSLQGQKKHIEAEKLFRRALLFRRRLLPPDHIDILVSVSNLGTSLEKQGRLEEARGLHEIAYTGRERAFGSEHHETLKSKANLAVVSHHSGHHAESATLMEEVSTSYKKVLGPGHPDAIQALKNYAIMLEKQARFSEAETIIVEVLSLQEKTLGKKHVKTLETLLCLSLLFDYQHKYEEALIMATELVDKRTDVLGRDHPDTVCASDFVKELQEIIHL